MKEDRMFGCFLHDAGVGLRSRRRRLFGVVLASLLVPMSAFGSAPLADDDLIAVPALLKSVTPPQRDKLLVKEDVRTLGICGGKAVEVQVQDGPRLTVIQSGAAATIPIALRRDFLKKHRAGTLLFRSPLSLLQPAPK